MLLEGPMGAGKTAFARALLGALDVIQPPQGSPSFAIAHEYGLKSELLARGVVHIDLYRIKSENEIEEAGIPAYFWDPSKIIVCEWLSMWPEFERAVLRAGENWKVSFEFEESPELRHVRIERPVRPTS